MVRLTLVSSLIVLLVSCSTPETLEGDAASCALGETEACVCEDGGFGSRACDSFTRTWSVCLCGWEVEQDAASSVPDGFVQGPSFPEVGTVSGVIVGGANVNSSNYRLRVAAPAMPASKWLKSESYRLRLGLTLSEESP